jgi:hypothetical protein
MSVATPKRVSAGTQLSWLALLSPIISIGSLIFIALLATVGPIGLGAGTRTETSDGGYAMTYELGFAASLISNLTWLFLILAVVAAILTFSLRSGRQKMNLVRASIGLFLVAGIVGWFVFT